MNNVDFTEELGKIFVLSWNQACDLGELIDKRIITLIEERDEERRREEEDAAYEARMGEDM